MIDETEDINRLADDEGEDDENQDNQEVVIENERDTGTEINPKDLNVDVSEDNKIGEVIG